MPQRGAKSHSSYNHHAFAKNPPKEFDAWQTVVPRAFQQIQHFIE
jgi:hypothetical protein